MRRFAVLVVFILALTHMPSARAESCAGVLPEPASTPVPTSCAFDVSAGVHDFTLDVYTIVSSGATIEVRLPDETVVWHVQCLFRQDYLNFESGSRCSGYLAADYFGSAFMGETATGFTMRGGVILPDGGRIYVRGDSGVGAMRFQSQRR